MHRRQFLRYSGTAAIATLTAGCGARQSGTETTATDEPTATETATPTDTETETPTRTPPPGEYLNPVYEPVLADPSVVRADDDTFYAYGTETSYREGREPVLVNVLRSRNLVDWTFVGSAFEQRPDWKDAGGLWAPDIARYRDHYYLFYAYSTWGDENPGIGVATANSPEGPFTDHGELIRSDAIGVPNSIDPMFYVDDGTPYLFWGSFNGIYGIELTADARDHVGASEKFQVAGTSFEAPFITKRDGQYYLFLSAGTCCEGPYSTYHVVVGRSDSLTGPYRGAEGGRLLDNEGSLVVQGGNGFVGPGHNCVLDLGDGDHWTLYHAYEEGEPYVGGDVNGELRRTLMLDPLTWTDDGFPVIEDRVPSQHAELPPVAADE